ncbi:sodium:alanine symporter family protein [Denitrobacterium detoxificans]|jgi:AGCS family alanine or glycine:cation symporter|uniref:alanine/glycine:cation symporter family protein n=1 Tax=Denitrobacterium detoxificans TaxID=79604 RepID=UPI0026F1A637|nr:amino acid carrier protein [Denitrobacterium detoxificans]MBE6466248.1 sodium:alanine symporter family protein [Denitrobacterium detoxificans]
MDFITAFSDIVSEIDSFVWGWAMIALLLGTHIYSTVRTKFIQRKIGTAIKLSFSSDDADAEGDVSQFGALTAALAATIGTGNIVGVATGLLAGGPGAIFWMWITGVFGIATKYAETYISVKYRVRDANGEMLGGAMYALERGLKHKKLGRVLAVLFAVFAFVASFGIGASVQSNALAGVVTAYIPDLQSGAQAMGANAMIGVFLVILVGVVILGGIKSVTRVTERLVPLMAVLYAAGCLVIICMNGQYVVEAVGLILTCAFTGQAAFGGAVGSGIALALQYGFKRGLFSNESGLGSAPLVAANATTKNPARQALVSMSGTFWDTVIICAITGIMLVSTMLANPSIEAGILAGDITAAAELTTTAFSSIPVLGPLVLGVGMILFTYSTMLGWSTYGNRAVMYLFGKKGIRPYQVVFLLFVFWGCIGGGELVWNISDITNALMAVPNCIAVLALGGVVAAGTNHYVYEKNLDEVDEAVIPQLQK